MNQEFELVAKTLQGLENVLAKELTDIGASNVAVHRRAVSFSGNLESIYRANFHCRTALRILKPIYSFTARNEEELYGQAKEFDWASIMDVSHKFAVDSVVNSTTFNHSRYVALKLKDAVVDQFRERVGRRPFVDPKKPHIQLHIHVSEQECTVLLDSSGESLHRRGYRQHQDVAPLNEVLAAGLIQLAGWDMEKPFIDPMCGSGTLLIEAALLARGIAPGVFRKEYAFEHWLDFDRELFGKVYNDDSLERESEVPIIGNDMSERAIEITRENLKNAGLSKIVTLENQSVFDLTPPLGPGIVITNPPYGERLKKDQIETFYKQLGDCFKQKYDGYDVWMLAGNPEAAKNFGLHPSKTHTLFNGAIECKYQKFGIYKGSKKVKYRDPESEIEQM